jgi:hypoxia up-regulated 1
VHRKSLEVTKYYEGRVKPHSPELLAASKAKLYEMAQRDKERILLQEAKNKVESYIYKIKNKLMDDEDAVAAVTSSEQRELVHKLAVDAEEWLEDDGYDANITVMEAKFVEISAPMEKILFRMEQKTALPLALKALDKQLNDTVNLMTLWETSKPHITAEEREMIIKQVDEIKEWVVEKQTNQTSILPHEDPVFTSLEIPERTKILETLLVALSKKPVPKVPKKKKTNTTDTNSTDGNSPINVTTTENATTIDDDGNSTTANTTTTTTDEKTGDGDEL